MFDKIKQIVESRTIALRLIQDSVFSWSEADEVSKSDVTIRIPEEKSKWIKSVFDEWDAVQSYIDEVVQGKNTRGNNA